MRARERGKKMHKGRIKLTRRDFIKLSTNLLFGLSGLLGLGILIHFFNYRTPPDTPSEFDLGDPSLYPIGSRTIRADIPAVIYNSAGVITAYTLTCTHLGCTVEEYEAGFACPCHGSRFNQYGEVMKGPAQKPLRKFRVEVQEGNTLKLFLDRGG